MSIFSLDCLSLIVQMSLYPLTAQAKARPIPVLPEVHSMTVPPGLSWPLRSAASIMLRAIRSLTLCPGLKYSTLARTGQGKSSAIWFIRIMGVLPMAPRMFSWMIMTGWGVCQRYRASQSNRRDSTGSKREIYRAGKNIAAAQATRMPASTRAMRIQSR